MSLTPREAFKYGFMARCLEQGHDLDGIEQQVKLAMVKLAGWSDLLTKPLGLAGKAATGLGSGAWAAIPALAAAPPILGGMAGYALARGTDVNERDVKEVQKDELTDEYRRQTELLHRVKAIRDARRMQKRPGRPFM